MDDFKNYGEEKYKIEIIKEFEEFEELEDPKKCVRVENYMIRDHMLLKDGLCLNRSYHCNGEKVFSTVGTHPSEETRKKLSEAHKGQSPSEETRKKLSEAHKGIPRSEETRKKMSIALKGQSRSEETRKKLSIAKKGTHLSEETRKKLSISKKGRPASNRIKISIGDNTFDSITEASKYYKMSDRTISYWLKTKKHNAFYIEK